MKPLLIITPFHESEIQSTIYCSKKLRTQIRVRSGGHDYEGLSYTSSGPFTSRVPFVVVDMRNFRSITVNTDDKTAWVQAGATLGELYYALARESKTLGFPAGTCPSVGVGGHFSGGGYGMISRKHAIASDRIIDAVLIDASGRILDRGSMGEDHFWAIRGGGGTSFGIVLAFKVSLVSVPETVTVFNVTRTLEENATQLVHRWQHIANKIDENLLIRLFIRNVWSGVDSKDSTVAVSFTSLFLGRARDLVPLLHKEFPELGLVEKDCTEMSWIESVLFFTHLSDMTLDDALLHPNDLSIDWYTKGKSDYVTQPIPVHGLRGMWRFLREDDERMVELQLSPYGGVLDTFSESETPFPHRAGNIFLIQYMVYWSEGGNAETHMDWVRRLYTYMTPYVSKSPREAYLNYRDLDLGMNNQGYNTTSYEQASVWGFKYFKNNFERLVRVKTQVDPSNFFRNEQSIPPLTQTASW
ncbi:cannabidiolic acid synthase [Phtheirospermum japonicum]|uniref:Cannabidiolic acid synthase n=1 Tax=Phtheirospermum japonicum TaxID=374723 RepID=A0A830CUS3_9LAMI|nr:cannabidiolic acid synthase [Phtheirospermum japonicum]